MANVQESSASSSSSLSTDTSQTYQNQCFGNGTSWYLNPKLADVRFTFGVGGKRAKRIPAHKTILAVNSRVFEAMFYGELKESGDVHMVDSNESAFVEFLQYFYLSEVKLTAKNITGVLYLGEKYNVEKCVKDCVQFLMHTLNNGNVCGHLDLGIVYDQKLLIDACKKHILLNSVAVFQTVDFLNCAKKALGEILKMDAFSCTEVEVFEACMTWVKAKIGRADLSLKLIKLHLGDLYYDIRFASMTMDQLCTLQTKYKSILSHDFVTISKIIVQPEFKPTKFNKNQRHAEWDTDAIIECDRDEDYYEQRYYQTKDFETTTFSTNQALFLGSFWCSGIYYGDDDEDDPTPCDLSTEMQIIETASFNGTDPKVLSTMKVQLESDDTEISLPHPVLIRPGFFYKIRLGPFPRNHCYYGRKLKASVQLEPDIKIEFLFGCLGRALISMLNFNKI